MASKKTPVKPLLNPVAFHTWPPGAALIYNHCNPYMILIQCRIHRLMINSFSFPVSCTWTISILPELKSKGNCPKSITYFYYTILRLTGFKKDIRIQTDIDIDTMMNEMNDVLL